MKFLFDFFPILLFFVAYKMGGIFVATGVAIVASFVQVGFFWLRHRRFETMHLVSLGLIGVLGGLTLVFQDKTFIQWKPTLLNWVFAAVFLGSQFIGKKPLVERMMSHTVNAERSVWLRLNVSWVLFFIAMGAANLYVAFHYDEETWVNFKLFGMMGLTFLFVIAQAFFLAKHVEMVEPEAEAAAEKD
ncbi:septation protein A [Endothiovibrio diazotrophicus]